MSRLLLVVSMVIFLAISCQWSVVGRQFLDSVIESAEREAKSAVEEAASQLLEQAKQLPELAERAVTDAIPFTEKRDEMAAPTTIFARAIVAGTSGQGLRCRTNPGTNSAIATKFQDGEGLEVVGGPVNRDGYMWWTVAITGGRSCWVADDWLVFTAATGVIGPLSNLAFVYVTGNLIEKEGDLIEVGSVEVEVEITGPACSAFAKAGIEIYSEGVLAWKTEAQNAPAFTYGIVLLNKVQSAVVSPAFESDDLVIVKRGDSHIIIDFVTQVADFDLTSPSLCVVDPTQMDNEIDSLLLPIP